MGYAKPTRGPRRARFAFRRELLPLPLEYFASAGVRLQGSGVWRSTICPFHNDKNPSLRIRPDTGAFRCMVCGSRGGDILSFHMLRHGMSFKAAARDLGAWEESR